jgi:hypothetical protein
MFLLSAQVFLRRVRDLLLAEDIVEIQLCQRGIPGSIQIGQLALSDREIAEEEKGQEDGEVSGLNLRATGGVRGASGQQHSDL